MSHSFKADVEYVPTLPTDPQPDKPVLEPSRDVCKELAEARDESNEADVSSSQFVNAAPESIKPTEPLLEDDELSSVDLNESADEWTEVDTIEGPTPNDRTQEAGWESVELNTAVAKCSLDGEDEYSVESFRSSRKKENLSEYFFFQFMLPVLCC